MTIAQKIIHWIPRVLSIVFVLFLSMFALDVFNEYQGWQLILALFMHLLPALALLLVTVIAWKYDLVGTIFFFGFAVWYIWMAGFDKPWTWYAVIASPAVIVGLLYLASWRQKRKNKTRLQIPSP
jgi:hypothetical protein